ncbi:MAG: acyl-CoA thioesterase [Chloroflexota bacterium]|nr:acyl-CoA thioesterase [Anaerolineales bacterium]
MNTYSRTYQIRFSDIDANRHVNNAAYIDAAGDMRYQFFAENGFPPERFEQLGVGVVYTKITSEFLREVLLGETVTVTFALAGLSPLGVRWKVHHDFLKSNGKKAVSMDMEGMLLDLSTRKPVQPNEELLRVFQLIPRRDGFEVLPEMRRMK